MPARNSKKNVRRSSEKPAATTASADKLPADFVETVEAAVANREPGDLALLAHEVADFPWKNAALRLIGRGQFRLQAFEAARATWEQIADTDPADVEADSRLATIYQRLGDLDASDQALWRVLAQPGLAGKDRAELLALRARNTKARWKDQWSKLPAEAGRVEAALTSPQLRQAADAYAEAFAVDLNEYYPGLNALGLVTILIELARAQPEKWSALFKSPAAAERELRSRNQQRDELAANVKRALDAAVRAAESDDIWLEIAQADFLCLTSRTPASVASAYRRFVADAADFEVESARSQLLIYRDLDVLTPNVTAALDALPKVTAQARHEKVLIFTGHMVDKPERSQPRFPAAQEAAARAKIKEAVAQEIADGAQTLGIAGGASGGDILFHEVCAELGVPTQVYLALPPKQYIAESVAPAGGNWVERFKALYARLPVRELAKSKELPRWLRAKRDYTIWERNNLWTLYGAFAHGARNVTLITLWDGKAGDGPGGTKDMVEQAWRSGARTTILDVSTLVRGAKSPPAMAQLAAEEKISVVPVKPTRAAPPPPPKQETPLIFISYSHKDHRWLEKLQVFLRGLFGKDPASYWDDTKIDAGDEWRSEIVRSMESAKIAILLVSQDFLASKFIRETELPAIIAGVKSKQKSLFWIAISPSTYKTSELADYQAANEPTKPLASLRPAKVAEVLVGVCEKIKAAADAAGLR